MPRSSDTFLYASWNFDLKTIGPFVLPSASRKNSLKKLINTLYELKNDDSFNEIRLFDIKFIVPVRNSPQVDVVMLANGDFEIKEKFLKILSKDLKINPPKNVMTGFNPIKFGNTDMEKSPILLNHFSFDGSDTEVLVERWHSISEWYLSKLKVNNSTLIKLDYPKPYAVMNYAAIPGPVVKFMLNQVLRPSFYRNVPQRLREIQAKSLPIFGQRIMF